MKNKETLLNLITGFFLQLFTIISGIIIPRIILLYFGSEVNGLISSLNQFLSYITLIEGGVSGVIIANLYKPLINNDNIKLSSIIVTSDKFYKKIGFIFILYSIVLATVYPLIFIHDFNFIYVFTLTIILSSNLFIQYMFAITLRNVLTADKKVYIVNLTQTVIIILNVALALISVLIYPSIHFLKLISGCLFILQPVVYGIYAKKHYLINWNAQSDNTLINERWNGFAINFAAFIHNSTDIVILTIFTDLKIVSIYSVYCLVSNGLKNLINACVSGINAAIGQSYAKKDFNELNKKMDAYEYIIFMMVFITFTVAALLITPFVQIYTIGVTDTNYCQPLFGTLLLISEALYLIKLPHMNLAYCANKFKEITPSAFIEAGMNIVISIILVGKFGLIGVTIGTIIAMTYRTIFHVRFTSKIINGRTQSIFYRKSFIFILTSVIGYLICYKLLPLTSFTLLSWVTHSIIYCLIIGGLHLASSYVFFKNEIIFFINYMRR